MMEILIIGGMTEIPIIIYDELIQTDIPANISLINPEPFSLEYVLEDYAQMIREMDFDIIIYPEFALSWVAENQFIDLSRMDKCRVWKTDYG